MTVVGTNAFVSTDDRPTAAVRPIRAVPVAVERPAPRSRPLEPEAPAVEGAGGGPVRIAVHLTLAALPLLAISAHVFGLLPMHLSAALVVLPLTVAVGLLVLFDPLAEERVVLRGAVWGAFATLVYDVFRLDTVYLLGWWGDFIPTMGTWILDENPDATGAGAVVGYLWRYAGDGAGIGAVFFVLAAATGLRRLGRWPVVGVAVGFAVFPVWTGLVATVGIAPRGEEQMFPLTPTTLTLSLIGHLVFGLVLGLGCARAPDLERDWPYRPVLDLAAWQARLRDGRAARPVMLDRPAGIDRGDVVRGGTSRAGGVVPTWGPQTGGHRIDLPRERYPAGPRGGAGAARPAWWDGFAAGCSGPVAPAPGVTELTMPVPPPRVSRPWP